MDTDLCLRCSGRITRTGTVAGRASDVDDELPVGFCERCRTTQVRRDGLWLALGAHK